MSEPTQAAHGDSLCIADLVRRANVRKRRLHACGCMRLTAPKRKPKAQLELVAAAERYADGETTADQLMAAAARRQEHHAAHKWGGDYSFAFQSDHDLMATWDRSINAKSTYTPTDQYYDLVLFRYRVYQDLVGPDPLPAFAPEWRTDTALALAHQMYDAREFGAMPILADALQDAGCDSEAILTHCRSPDQQHVRGCWVVDLVLGTS